MQGRGGPERLEGVHESVLPADRLIVDAPESQEPVGSEDALPAVLEANAGDTPTFADFYAASYGDMVRLAYLLTGSAETARDLVQDSFLRVHGKWERVDEPRAYLRRAVVNACNSHHRRISRQREHARAIRVESASLDAEEMADAIAALPYRQRAAIVLRYWHDCSEADIAATLGCRPGTVGSLIHRALAELRKVIP
jgi:RNA polymerase sigma-70 factor (sigma-E family)